MKKGNVDNKILYVVLGFFLVAAVTLVFMLGSGRTTSRRAGGGGDSPYTPSAQQGMPAVGVPQSTSPPPTLESASEIVSASSGGTVSLDNISLEVPSGALSKDTEIVISRSVSAPDIGVSGIDVIQLKPSGTIFSTPAILTLNYDEPINFDEEMISFYTFDESTYEWEELEIVDYDFANNQVSVQVEHFSYLVSIFNRPVDIVLDIPGEYLSKGDLIYALTPKSNAFTWFPGHAAMYLGTKESSTNQADLDGETIIESTPLQEMTLFTCEYPGVRFSTLNEVDENKQYFKDPSYHIYMGARRLPDLSDEDRTKIAEYAINAENNNANYAAVAQANIRSNCYSCVGLTEAAYDFSGNSVIPAIREFPFIFPLQQYIRTEPVNEITVIAGKKVEVDVNRVVRNPVTKTFSADSIVTFSNCPDDAECKNGRVRWQTDSNDIGTSSTILVSAQVKHTNGKTYSDNETLTINVIGDEAKDMDGGTATILVFDTSGSMEDEDQSGYTKMEAAVQAGTNILDFIDAENSAGLGLANQIGVVEFSNYAQSISELTTNISETQNALSFLYPDGGTALPQGLSVGLHMAENVPDEVYPIIILLSDGIPNIDLNDNNDEYSAREDTLRLASQAGDQGICVYTVGFGVPGTVGSLTGEASIDEDFMIEVAERSGCGKYYNAQNAAELANIYVNLRHESMGDLLFQSQGQISQGETANVGDVQIPQGQKMLLYTLRWPGSQLDPVLFDPSGKPVDVNYPGASISVTSSLATVIVQDPIAGNWRLGAVGVDVPEGVLTYNAALSTRTGDSPSISGRQSIPSRRGAGGILPFAIFIILASAVLIYYVKTRQPKVTAAYLQITNDPNNTRMIPLKKDFIIGRSKGVDFRLADTTTSRHHARITYGDGAWFIQDMGSSGGTFVNGKRVQATRLHNDDQIKIGQATFIFRRQ